MTTAEKLLYLMDERDRTQAQLVRETGMWQSSLSAVCAGQRKLKLNEALALSRALDVPLEWLADDAQGLPAPMQPSQQRELVKLINDLGYAVAKARLLGVPEVKAAPGQEFHRPGGKAPRGKPNRDSRGA